MILVFSSWATGPFSLLNRVWGALVGFFTTIMLCGCNSLSVVSDMVLMYGNVTLFHSLCWLCLFKQANMLGHFISITDINPF